MLKMWRIPFVEYEFLQKSRPAADMWKVKADLGIECGCSVCFPRSENWYHLKGI